MTAPAGNNVVELASVQTVDAAWEALCHHRQRLLDDGVSALLDREWVEEDARLDKRFRRLFMLQEASA